MENSPGFNEEKEIFLQQWLDQKIPRELQDVNKDRVDFLRGGFGAAISFILKNYNLVKKYEKDKPK